MLILGVEPSLIAYKTIVRTDTLYELIFTIIFDWKLISNDIVSHI
jgi:hypothetical protein